MHGLGVVARAACTVALGIAVAVAEARAEDAAAFFAGKTIRVVVGSSAGGSSGLSGLVLSEHFGRHIPGNPNVTPQFMDGAGGTRAANYVYNAAPKDGTVIGVALPTILTTQLLYPDQVKYDVRRFVWLGSMFGFTGVISVLHDAPAKTVEAAKRIELVIGATGVGSPAYQDPALAKALLGLNFKIVTGYKGGNEITLAMERGEVHGRSMSSNAWEAQRPDWVRDGRLVHLLQIGPGDPKRMAGVPRLIDLVAGEREKAVARFAEIAPRTGWTVYLPPDVPPERAQALRDAFAAAFRDPVFVRALADATKADIAPVLGEEFTRFVAEVMATPEPVIAEVRRIFGQGS